MAERRKYTRLSESAWAEARALWEVGDSSLEELSAHFAISTRALQLHFAKHGVKKGARARTLAAAVETEIFRRELSDKELLIERAKETKELAYANAQVVERLVMAQLKMAQENPSEAFKAGTALKMLSLASATLERLHGLKRIALGLDKENVIAEELPQLIFRDLSKEELEAIRATHDDSSDCDIVKEDTTTPPRGVPTPDEEEGAEEEENEIVEVRGRESDEPAMTAEGFRFVRGAR